MAIGAIGPCVAFVQNARLALIAVKVIHTVIWAFFAGCIVAVPVTALRGRFRLSALLSGLVLVECAVLAVNDGRCPLTDVAARFTVDHADNFDIYLPLWLAHWNKAIFGTLFATGEVLLAGCLATSRSRRS
jgi:hypothetical protein